MKILKMIPILLVAGITGCALYSGTTVVETDGFIQYFVEQGINGNPNLKDVDDIITAIREEYPDVDLNTIDVHIRHNKIYFTIMK